jgi:hypothetical protein
VQSANLSAAGEARLHGQGLFLLGSVVTRDLRFATFAPHFARNQLSPDSCI